MSTATTKNLTSKRVGKYTHVKLLSVKLCQHEAVHFCKGIHPIKIWEVERQSIISQHKHIHSFIHSFIHSYCICLYVTVFLNPSPHPHVSNFQSVGHKLTVNKYYVLYYIKLSA
jgi:hypothetical protein